MTGDSIGKVHDDMQTNQLTIYTNPIYKNNDPSTRKPKSSKGDKYKNLISNIWHERNNTEGSGLQKYNKNPIEYRYINNLNKFYNTMNYIYAQEKAGHNNFTSEKRAIKDFISNKLDELIEMLDRINI